MLRFLTRLFAVIGLLVTVGGIAGLYIGLHQQKQAVEPDNVVLTLDFDQDIVEQNEPSPLDFAIGGGSATPLLEILRAIDHAKLDPHVKGIVARFGSTEPSFAQAQEISEAITRFRTSGKFTYAFGPSYGDFGLGNRTYYLASAFENIWLQPVGAVGLTGLVILSPFGKTALDKIGITADFMHREEYKSFMDMATRDDFAPPVRENMQSLIDDLANQEAQGIADNRKWDAAHVKDLMAKGPYTDEEALKEGLVTRLGYADELDKEINNKAGKDAKNIDPETYMSYGSPTSEKAPPPKAVVALIYGTGMIMDKGVGTDGLTGEKALGADTVASAFYEAADNKDVKAILFRIDSPGGSPSASETIRRSIVHAKEMGKPVFVSMGDTAASGGYWIAMNADYIAADPGTMTGSIGVISGKFSGAELMKKLGVNVDAVRTADNAGMWMPVASFTPQQRDRVNALLDNSYKVFTQNVAAARKIPLEKMPDIAKGRVWTGSQAVKIGLVDEVGGYATTIAALRKKLGLTETDQMVLEPFPPPETTVEKIQHMLKALGLENAMIMPMASQLRMLQTTLAPMLSSFSTTPVEARMPAMVVH